MNTGRSFSISEAFIFGWNSYFRNFMLFLKTSLAFYGACAGILILFAFFNPAVWRTVLSGSFPPFVAPYGIATPIILNLFMLVAREYYLYQMTKFGLKLYAGQIPQWKEVFTVGEDFGSFFMARILYSIRTFLWALLLLIPGFYYAITYYFTGFPLLDGRAQTVAEDKELAGTLSLNCKWLLFWFFILTSTLSLICLLGLVTLLVEPLFDLAHVHAYKQLQGNSTAQ